MSLPPNFCFPVHDLSSDKVKLTPFDITKHSAPFIAATTPHPDLYRYLSWDPFPSVEAFNAQFFDAYMTPSPDRTCFAVLDISSSSSAQTQPGSPSPMSDRGPDHSPDHSPDAQNSDADGDGRDYPLAGIISLMSTSPAHLTTELGWVITLPAYQRTHVTTHAIGLLLRYALDSPAQGGLGLRRVQWIAHSGNEASVRVAKRMGFVVEGVLRWHRLIVDAERRGKAGGRVAINDSEGGHHPKVDVDQGRDSVFLSVVWDDWVGGGRERVMGLIGGR